MTISNITEFFITACIVGQLLLSYRFNQKQLLFQTIVILVLTVLFAKINLVKSGMAINSLLGWKLFFYSLATFMSLLLFPVYLERQVFTFSLYFFWTSLLTFILILNTQHLLAFILALCMQTVFYRFAFYWYLYKKDQKKIIALFLTRNIWLKLKRYFWFTIFLFFFLYIFSFTVSLNIEEIYLFLAIKPATQLAVNFLSFSLLLYLYLKNLKNFYLNN